MNDATLMSALQALYEGDAGLFSCMIGKKTTKAGLAGWREAIKKLENANSKKEPR